MRDAYSFTLLLYNLDPSFSVSADRPFNTTAISELETSLKNKYFQHWKSILKNSPKLSFYGTFKQCYEEEPYLNLLNSFEHRRLFTKFRISNHDLQIETRRYNKIAREDRICTMCNENTIESEQHLIQQCSLNSDLRLEFQSKIQDKIDFSKNYIATLMKSTDSYVVFHLSKFISKCFLKRKEKSQEV